MMSEEKKLYLVETVSMFKMQYVIEAKSEADALDEVTMKITGDPSNWEEFSQKHLDEIIVSSRKIKMKQFKKLFDKENGYLSSWTDEQKIRFINKIDYDDGDNSVIEIKGEYFREDKE
jgi:hypothetical protein